MKRKRLRMKLPLSEDWWILSWSCWPPPRPLPLSPPDDGPQFKNNPRSFLHSFDMLQWNAAGKMYHRYWKIPLYTIFYHSVCTVLQPFDVDLLVRFLQNYYFVQLSLNFFLLNICLVFKAVCTVFSVVFFFLQIELCCFQNVLIQFFHWNLTLWYSKHILSHCEGSQKCNFYAPFVVFKMRAGLL